MPIQTCLFDMGNVLVYFSHQKMCENIASVAGIDLPAAKAALLDSGLQWRIESGAITEEQFHAQFCDSVGKDVDFEELKLAAADIFWLNDSIVPLVDELKALGIRLVLLSNTSVTHLRFIQERFSILQKFDALTTSFEAGALKPDAAIYEDALSKANCEPPDCFYTDDIEDYVVKARSFGINAEVYTQTPLTRQALIQLGVNVSSE